MNDSSCDGSFELAADDQERVLARTELLTAFDKVRGAPGTGAAAAAATAAAAAAAAGSEPSAKRPRVSMLQRRAVARGTAQDQEAAMAAAALVEEQQEITEVHKYLAQPLEVDLGDGRFKLLRFWQEKGTRKETVIDGRTVVLTHAELPILSRIACQQLGTVGTSCEAERTFSALALMYDTLRTALRTIKLEMMMFVRLNRRALPPIAALLAAQAQRDTPSLSELAATAASAVQIELVASTAAN